MTPTKDALTKGVLTRLAAVSLITVAVISPAAGGDAASTKSSKVPTFQVDSTWPQLPNHWVMGDVSAVAVDRHDNVWILHRPRTVPADRKDRSAPPVVELDAAGKFVQAWGGPGEGFEWPDDEHGIFVDYKDNVWITGNNPNVQVRLTSRSDDMLLKFTNKGKLILQIGHRDQSGGNKDTKNVKQPADIMVYRKTNEAVVADGYGNRRVIVLDADTGAFKRMWGAFGNTPLDPPPPARPPANAAPTQRPALETEGPGPQQFGIVHSAKVSNDGLIYVADRGNRRIQVFTLAGKYVTQMFINRSGPSANSACGIAFSPDPQQQFLYVADFGNSHIVVVDRKALKVVDQFGSQGSEPGNFRNIHFVAADSKGNLYTAEVSPGSRAQKFVFKGFRAGS